LAECTTGGTLILTELRTGLAGVLVSVAAIAITIAIPVAFEALGGQATHIAGVAGTMVTASTTVRGDTGGQSRRTGPA